MILQRNASPSMVSAVVLLYCIHGSGYQPVGWRRAQNISFCCLQCKLWSMLIWSSVTIGFTPFTVPGIQYLISTLHLRRWKMSASYSFVIINILLHHLLFFLHSNMFHVAPLIICFNYYCHYYYDVLWSGFGTWKYAMNRYSQLTLSHTHCQG